MNFDKIVKLACKPKIAAPKTKYLDPVIAATYGDDGTLQEVCRALAPKLQEANVIVVLKALIVLHTMIRNGHTDNILNYIASSDTLRLRQVANGERHGYPLPENTSNYAVYLETRARAYRDLKHDAIRIQSESNRDRHLSMAGGSGSNGQPSRSKTVMGRKLRVMTVEKGLLRETKIVQKQVDALLGCRLPLTKTRKFFMDNLEDELTLSALSLLVKDLLILFSAENEGVINVLEHYFEMSFNDAEQALAVYKYFCEQTERVVEYLAIARKLSNLINVPIPNLKHAPLSLAKALDEYLHDPNFEQNRIEYKTNKALADGTIPNKAQPRSAPLSGPSQAAAPTPSTSSPPAKVNVPSIDFFNSIEEQQPTMFNSQTQSPNTVYFYQNQGQAVNPGLNPFRASMVVPQMTGIPGATQPFINPQPTGFPGVSPFPILAQATGMPFLNMQHTATPFNPQPSASPFANGAQNALSSTPQETQNAFLRPQTAPFLQPQPTGSNPFRQSMFLPQTTGMPLDNTSGFGVAASPSPLALQQPQAVGFANFLAQQSPMTPAPDATKPYSPFAGAMINRPASTPAGHSHPPAIKPLVPHVTGSRNPFGQPRQSSPPPVPKAPTIQELLAARANGIPLNPQHQQATPTGVGSQQAFSAFGTSSGLSPFKLTENPNQNMSSVASSFSLGNHEPSKDPALPTLTSQPTGLPQFTAQNTSTTTTSGYSDAFSALSLNSPAPSTTGTAFTSVSGFNTNGPLQPQATGFSGLKPFKPTSAFGASLMDSLPTVPGSGAATPSGQGSPKMGSSNPALTLETSSNTSTLTVPSFGMNGSMATQTWQSAVNAQGTGSTGLSGPPSLVGMNSLDPNLRGGGTSTVGVGLRPQATGTANPFRASMISPQMTGMPFSPTSGSGVSTGASLFGGGAGGIGSGIGGLQGSGFGAAPFRPTLAAIPSFTGGSTLPLQQQPGQQPPQAQKSFI